MAVWNTIARDNMKKSFLCCFFPKTKYLEKGKEVVGFQQEDEENLYDALESYEFLIKRCLGHKFLEMEITLTFTYGLKPTTRMLLDASAGGAMKNKIAAEV